MATIKKLNRANLKENRTISTTLINKEEVFRMTALAEASGLPLLLVGAPGTAKTKAVIEYSKAWLQKDGATVSSQDFMDKLYILETDEGTKSSEVKGMPNLSKLFTENEYELCAPISSSDIVIINEIDKASSNIRNSLLGVMNEKFLFNGKIKLPCKWKLFVATCNEIPKDEINSPFWDRFVLKMQVSRISANEISKYYEAGDKNYKESMVIGIPNKEEINAVDIPRAKLEKFIEVAYSNISDRTLTFAPHLTKIISLIWNISVDKALVKLTSILINNNAAITLQNKLYSPEIKTILNKVEALQSYNDNSTLTQALNEIEQLMLSYTTLGHLDSTDVAEIETSISYILENHPCKTMCVEEDALVSIE